LSSRREHTAAACFCFQSAELEHVMPSSDAPCTVVYASPPQLSVTIESAGQGWGLIMQSGVIVPCTVGIPLKTLLREEFGLTPEQTGRIDVMLLNGKPVDTPETVIVPHGARLALAAGLPGIAGLSMKIGSAVRGLRPSITFRKDETETATPSPGEVELALFSIALGLLAEHFLARGVILRAKQFASYARRAKDEYCLFCEQQSSLAVVLEKFIRLPEDTPVLLTVRTAAYSE